MHTLPVRREFSCGHCAEKFSIECAGEGENRNGSTPPLQATSDITSLNRLWHLWERESVEYFKLGDLWNYYDEWSAYGVGDPIPWPVVRHLCSITWLISLQSRYSPATVSDNIICKCALGQKYTNNRVKELAKRLMIQLAVDTWGSDVIILNCKHCVQDSSDKSRFGRGGMTAKVNAAVCAAHVGIPVIITRSSNMKKGVKYYWQLLMLISLENEVDVADVVAAGFENSLISPLTLKHEKARISKLAKSGCMLAAVEEPIGQI
ncbi:Glutamate 5-kinase [Vigna unguiculata]|uniref:Glutamate 5-kinase n=1 Tax=Vigna unguiculata TaxID=3917 RepID=A0A4D6MD19_VIGUN|nr:Glutamate 5-kinase [Vigna unguiculata]